MKAQYDELISPEIKGGLLDEASLDGESIDATPVSPFKRSNRVMQRMIGTDAEGA